MELGEIIMTRELERGDAIVRVRVGKPMPFAEGETDCYVPFRIDGLGDDRVLIAGGVDGVQAMLFALAMIGDLLKNEQVTFLGMEPGFPITAPEDGAYVSTFRQPVDMSLLEETT